MDPYEFKNLAVTLPEDKKKVYLNLIEHMEMCSGESCHVWWEREREIYFVNIYKYFRLFTVCALCNILYFLIKK